MVGAQTNICHNALDRNVENGHGDKVCWHYLPTFQRNTLYDSANM